MTLPARAQKMLQETPPLVRAHFEAARNPYHPKSSPDGFINLGTAENHLMWDLLEPKLNLPRHVVEDDTHYAEARGTGPFRTAVARFLERSAKRPIDPENLMVSSGASSALNNLFHCLCADGEGVLVPAPYYPGFDHDLDSRAGVRRVPVPMMSDRGFTLEADDWQEAFDHANRQGIRIRAILLTNPHNPLGRTVPEKELDQALGFARERGLHVVCDELYAHSVFAPPRPKSLLSLAEDQADDVHVVYGFGKDFALSGFKVGVLHSTNPELRSAAGQLAYFTPVSNDTQRLLHDLLADEAWVDAYLEALAGRLREAYRSTTRELDRIGIGYSQANAGMFLWTDFRDAMKETRISDEKDFWDRMFHEARVNLSYGGAFHSPEQGWFRACYAKPASTVWAATSRLQSWLGKMRGS